MWRVGIIRQREIEISWVYLWNREKARNNMEKELG
jgi:hypothetical protein